MNLIHTLYQPRGAGPFPTVLTLHGRGASAFDLLGLAPYLAAGKFLMICPQGPVEMPIGPGALGYAWFPLALGGPPNVEAILHSREQLDEFLSECIARYPIDPQKLVLLGFSQGGVMAYSLALSNPGRFAALAVLSSWLPEELLPRLAGGDRVRSLATLVQHGTEDPMIEIERARTSVDVLRRMGVPLTYREYEMAHEIGPQSLAELSAWLEKNTGATGRSPLSE
jgi:phospholipase/carboxylesterase